MSKWEKVRLGDLCDILSGYAFDSRDFTENDLDFPLIRIRDIVRGYTSTYYSGKYDDKYIIKNGDFLIGMDGEFNISEWKGRDALLNQRVCKITPISNVLEKRYMLFFLPKALKKIEYATSFVTVKHLSTKTISQIKIPLPPLKVQKKIAQTLDAASELIALRKKQLAELDNLIKATFYDMFGDPVINEKGWKVKTVNDVCKKIVGGGTPSKSRPEYYVGSIPWVTPKDMKSILISDSIDHITEEAIENSSAKLISAKSILMVIRSGILKRTLPLAINTVNVAINQDMKAFIINTSVTVEYLLYFFVMMEKDILKNVRAVTADNIEFSLIKNLNIPCPPIECQNQFAQIVTKIEEQKALVQKALNESQYLFDSLMSQYFE